jgi:hypothetical protein
MDLTNLPGSELILPGLEDLRNGNNNTIGALLITIASQRLTAAGLEFPTDNLTKDPELTLYNYLHTQRSDPYPYYNALLASLNSFCNALDLSRRQQQSSEINI